MAFILDQLLAIVIGAVLLVTLLTIQFRERQSAISSTITHSVRQNMNETMQPVADDLDNIWSPSKAGGGVLEIDTFTTGPYVGNGLTQFVRFPARAKYDTSDTSRSMAQVTYELVPLGTQANVLGEWYEQFGLVREVDFDQIPTSDAPAGTYATIEDTLARVLIDFKVGYLTGLSSGNSTARVGAPSSAAHSITMSALGARPTPDSTFRGRAAETAFSSVSYGKTSRLVNF